MSSRRVRARAPLAVGPIVPPMHSFCLFAHQITVQDVARDKFLQALAVEPSRHSLHVQIAFLLSPVLGSDAQIAAVRARFESNLDALLDPDRRETHDPPAPRELVIEEPLRSLEQTSKFYLQ